jgi:CheY-like chemotaxis protein
VQDKKGSILVIEDDFTIREPLREALEIEGYPVKTARHGKEALDLLEEGFMPSLILLDLMMPVMNGWEFLTEFSKQKKWAPIAVAIVTAYAGQSNINYKVAAYLKKPINMDQVFEVATLYC